MNSFLPHEISLLVLRHLAREGCPETVQCYINENSRVKEVLTNNKSFENVGNINNENYREILEGPSPNAGLAEILSEYGRAKILVHNLVKKLFEWKLLSPYYLSPYDTLATQLYHIEKLIDSKCKERKLTENKSIGTSDFPEFSISVSVLTDCIDAETQTLEDVENEEGAIIPNGGEQIVNMCQDPSILQKIIERANKEYQKKNTPDGNDVEIPTVSNTEVETDSDIVEKMLLAIIYGDDNLTSNDENGNIAIEDAHINLNTPTNSPGHDTSSGGGTSSRRAETNLIAMFQDAGNVIETTPISGTLIKMGPEDSVLSSTTTTTTIEKNNSQNQKLQPSTSSTTLVSTPSSSVSSSSSALLSTYRTQSRSMSDANYSMIKLTPNLMTKKPATIWRKLHRRQIAPIIPGNENKTNNNNAPPIIKIQNRRKSKLISPRKLTTTNISTIITSNFIPTSNTTTTTTSNNNNDNNDSSPPTSAVLKDVVSQLNNDIITNTISYNNSPPKIHVQSMEVEIIVPDIVNNINSPSTSHTTESIHINNDNENNTEMVQNITSNVNEKVSSSSPLSSTKDLKNIQQSNTATTDINTTTITNETTTTNTTTTSTGTESLILENNSNSISQDETPTTSQSVQKMREHPSFINRKSYTSPRKNNHIRSLLFKTPPGSKSERFENELASRQSFTGTPLKRALSYVSKFDFTLKKRLKLDGVIPDESTTTTVDNDENFNQDSPTSPPPHILNHNKILSPITEMSMSQNNYYDNNDTPNIIDLSQEMREIHESPEKEKNETQIIPIIISTNKKIEKAVIKNSHNSNNNNSSILQSTTNVVISTKTTLPPSSSIISPENIPVLEEENHIKTKTKDGKKPKKQPKRKCNDKKHTTTTTIKLPAEVEVTLVQQQSTIKQRKPRKLRGSKVKQETPSNMIIINSTSSENVEQVKETPILVTPLVNSNQLIVPLNSSTLPLTLTSKLSKKLEEQEDGEIIDDSSNSCGSHSPVIDIITIEDTNSNSHVIGHQNYNTEENMIIPFNSGYNSNNTQMHNNNRELEKPSTLISSSSKKSYNEREIMKHPKKRILPQPVPSHVPLPIFPPPMSTTKTQLPLPRENPPPPPKEYILSIPSSTSSFSSSYETPRQIVNNCQNNSSSKQYERSNERPLTSLAKSLGLSLSSDSEMDSSFSDTPSVSATATVTHNNNNNSTIIGSNSFNTSGENMYQRINNCDAEKKRFDLSSPSFMSPIPLKTSTPGTQNNNNNNLNSSSGSDNNNSNKLNTSLSLISPSWTKKTTIPVSSIFDTPSKPGDIYWNAGQSSASPRKSSTLSKLMDAALRRNKSNTSNKSELTSPLSSSSFTIQSSSFPVDTKVTPTNTTTMNTTPNNTIIITSPITSHSKNQNSSSSHPHQSSRHSSSSSKRARKSKTCNEKEATTVKPSSSSSRTYSKSRRQTPVKRESRNSRTSNSRRRSRSRSRSRSRDKIKERETKSRMDSTYSRRKSSTSFRYTPPIDVSKRRSTKNRNRRERTPQPTTPPPPSPPYRTTNETKKVDRRRKSSRRKPEESETTTTRTPNTKISIEQEQHDKTPGAKILEPSSSFNNTLITTKETVITSRNIPISGGLLPIHEPLNTDVLVGFDVSGRQRILTVSDTGEFNMSGMDQLGDFQQPPFLLSTTNITPGRDIGTECNSIKPQPQHILRDVNIDRFLSQIHPDYHV